MKRKGFPESYDTRRLLKFLRDLKSGAGGQAPVYSHVVYDIVAGEEIMVRPPDILILEGLNVLQVRREGRVRQRLLRLLDLRRRRRGRRRGVVRGAVLRPARDDLPGPDSFFRHFAHLTDEEAGPGRGHLGGDQRTNLSENILPTRERASLILRKAADHRVIRGPPAQALSTVVRPGAAAPLRKSSGGWGGLVGVNGSARCARPAGPVKRPTSSEHRAHLGAAARWLKSFRRWWWSG